MNEEGKDRKTAQILGQVTKKIGAAMREGCRELIPGKDADGDPDTLSKEQLQFILKWSLIALYAWILIWVITTISPPGGPTLGNTVRKIPFAGNYHCTGDRAVPPYEPIDPSQDTDSP